LHCPLRGLDLFDVHHPSTPAQSPVGFVEHDPGQPGQQGCVTAERGQLLERVHVGFLHHVLGFGIVIDHAACHAEKTLVAAPHDVAEGVAVAALHRTHQCRVVHRGVVDAQRVAWPDHVFLLALHIGCSNGQEVPGSKPVEPPVPSGALLR
jgi:hypothetical protein